MAKIGAEAGEDVVHQIGVCDVPAEIAEAIRERLQARAVGGDGHVALLLTVELVVEVDGASHCVVEKEVLDAAPDRVRRVVRSEDEGEDLLRDCGVQPRDDGVLVLDPLWIIVERVDVTVDVVEGAKLAERDDEEAAPHGVRRPLQVEGDLHLLLDDDVTQVLVRCGASWWSTGKNSRWSLGKNGRCSSGVDDVERGTAGAEAAW